jgi:hypothetical protein
MIYIFFHAKYDIDDANSPQQHTFNLTQQQK